MENYDIYNSICRVCLSYNTTIKTSLYDDTSEDGLSCFGKAVNSVTNVILKKGDKLPTLMCQNCTYILKQAVYFKLKCESSNKRLQNIINLNETKNLPNKKIKEIICEYTMFNHYFPEECSSYSSISIHNVNTDTEDTKVPESIEEKCAQPTIPKLEIELVVETKQEFDSVDDDERVSNADENDDKIQQNPESYAEDMDVILETLEKIVTSDTFMAFQRRPIKRKCFKWKQMQRKSDLRNRFKILRKESQIRRKQQNQQLVCNICNRTLANILTYDHHMQRHNNCRFICDQCGKGFPVQAEMRMHQVTRHNIGPYLECAHCPYKAPRKLNLIEHLRLHTGERPFTCEKCGLTFRRQAIWRNHLAVHSEKNVQCARCPRKFYRQSHLVAHMNNVHERLYIYMCKICRATYAKTETVRKHMMVKHGVPRELQGKILRINKCAGNDFPGS